MKEIFILITFLLFTGCNSKVNFLKAYEYAKENKDMNSRPGYAGKPCNVEIKTAIDCKINLETYKGLKFKTAYSWELKKNQSFSEVIKPDSYFITVIIEGKKYDDFVFQTFAPAWNVNLTNYIEAAYNTHKHQ